ncbi:MAG: purine-nucleoside phosphorylase [Clostridiales bacterium]|nr:purine-nucleoside phosphorylase [Clostridiales bacterium]
MIVNKEEYLKSLKNAGNYIVSRLNGRKVPEICLVLGSGLGPLSEVCDKYFSIPYTDIPDFPKSTAPGHAGTLIAGSLSGKDVFMMSGRFHYYEGYPIETVVFYVRVLGLIGVKTLILTNAAGGINTEMTPPEFVAITDHLSFFSESVLRGQNIDELGTRFPDQSNVYDKELVSLLEECAKDLNIKLSRGVYAYMKGPQYETPAEIRALRLLGADCVGMSTVPEAVCASHMGLRVAGISCITNMAAGIKNAPLSEKEVLETANAASAQSCALVKELINRM